MANKAGEIHRVEGSNETRRSPRYYTHAVVGEYDRPVAVKHTTEWTIHQARDTWTYNERKATAQPGVAVRFDTPNRPGIFLTFTADEIEKAQTFMMNNPSLNAFITFRVTDAIARFCADPDGKLYVLQWSQSEKSAVKAATSKSVQRNRLCRNVRVMKVQRG